MSSSMQAQQKLERYAVQIQEDCHHHSDTDDLAQAKYYARSLANWNVPAQVFDRATQKVIFRDRSYVEKIRLGLIDGPGTNQSAEGAGISGACDQQQEKRATSLGDEHESVSSVSAECAEVKGNSRNMQFEPWFVLL